MTIRQKLNTEKAAGIVCTMPFIVGFLAFMIIPMCISLYYSFCDYNILQPPTFTGWANFKRMFSDATFYQSLVVTFKFAIISVPLRLIFALIVALLLFKSTKMTGVYRALYYLPSIIGGSVAVAILWKRLFAVDGLVNKLLMVFGMKEPVAWLGDTRTAIWTLIILAVWQFGSSMLIFLSALKQIPVSLYEAARVDGANGWQQFWKITLKLLTPTIQLYSVLHGIHVPAVLPLRKYRLRRSTGMDHAGIDRIYYMDPVCNQKTVGIRWRFIESERYAAMRKWVLL